MTMSSHLSRHATRMIAALSRRNHADFSSQLVRLGPLGRYTRKSRTTCCHQRRTRTCAPAEPRGTRDYDAAAVAAHLRSPRRARRHGDRRVACAATTPRTCAPRGARNDTALRTAAFCAGGARDDAGSAARCVRGDDTAHVRNARRARRHRTFSAGGARDDAALSGALRARRRRRARRHSTASTLRFRRRVLVRTAQRARRRRAAAHRETGVNLLTINTFQRDGDGGGSPGGGLSFAPPPLF